MCADSFLFVNFFYSFLSNIVEGRIKQMAKRDDINSEGRARKKLRFTGWLERQVVEMKIKIAVLMPNLIRDVKNIYGKNDIFDWESYERILTSLSDVKRHVHNNTVFDMNYKGTKKIYISLN